MIRGDDRSSLGTIRLRRGGTFVRCPYDQVATFVFRNLPKKTRHDIRILEVGCGPGNNLWFLNEEGFACSGFDGSPLAIQYAKARCGKAVELKVAQFPEIPFEGPFDLVIERAALCCVPFELACETIDNVRKVLVPGGRFLYTPYSAQRQLTGYICNYTREMIEQAFVGWTILQLQHAYLEDTQGIITAEHRVWAQKPND